VETPFKEINLVLRSHEYPRRVPATRDTPLRIALGRLGLLPLCPAQTPTVSRVIVIGPPTSD
jgi:hypothetical protein